MPAKKIVNVTFDFCIQLRNVNNKEGVLQYAGTAKAGLCNKYFHINNDK